MQRQVLIGVLLTWVNATKLERLVYDRTGLQGTGELLVGVPEDPETVHLLFPPLRNENVINVPFEGAMARAIRGEMGIMRQRDYDGVKIIAAYRPVGFKSWGMYNLFSFSEHTRLEDEVYFHCCVCRRFAGKDGSVRSLCTRSKCSTCDYYYYCSSCICGRGCLIGLSKGGRSCCYVLFIHWERVGLTDSLLSFLSISSAMIKLSVM